MVSNCKNKKYSLLKWFLVFTILLVVIQAFLAKYGYHSSLLFFHVPSLMAIFASARVKELKTVEQREASSDLNGKIYKNQVFAIGMGSSVFSYILISLLQ